MPIGDASKPVRPLAVQTADCSVKPIIDVFNSYQMLTLEVETRFIMTKWNDEWQWDTKKYNQPSPS